MSEVVLDASALLVLLNREPGHEEVARIIPHAAIGTVVPVQTGTPDADGLFMCGSRRTL